MKGFDFDWLSNSALGRIRTLNPQSRNLVFYPVELRVHFQFWIANIKAYPLKNEANI